MGILIELADQDYQYCLDYANGKTNTMALNNTNRVIKAVADGTRYETRLKADMVAMLTEIQLEIEELKPLCNECDYAIDDCTSKAKVNAIIQQKINAVGEINHE